jgi:hypothetical protein
MRREPLPAAARELASAAEQPRDAAVVQVGTAELHEPLLCPVEPDRGTLVDALQRELLAEHQGSVLLHGGGACRRYNAVGQCSAAQHSTGQPQAHSMEQHGAGGEGGLAATAGNSRAGQQDGRHAAPDCSIEDLWASLIHTDCAFIITLLTG